ncbi:MAG: pyridoxal phosphate-dependent aminotransferase [Bacteroidaceae bacterium]|nr:pyridoxal phosphate-dependent aminotransferase [Bacteroidaceae bacterium]
MKYNFDEIVVRRGSNSIKWDDAEQEDVLPLWVADMDFKAAPAIREALARRVEHGVFGYTKVPDAYYDAIIHWFSRRHQWQINRDWMQYTIGVVPAISCIIKAISMPGDKVLVSTPVYNCFFSSIKNNGCEIVESPLRQRDDLRYEMDFEDFEQKCADSKVVAYLLCNPHNPCGRVWTREELEKIGEICRKHHVWVISDEIHNEIVMPGYQYIPFASISEANQQCSITCVSPSKSFNLAGLQIANIICSDAAMSRRIDRAININEVCDVNPFGVVATIAAYNESEDWIEELNPYIWKNFETLKQMISLPITPLEGTYLAWVNCSNICQKPSMNSAILEETLMEKAKVYLNAGTMYGAAGEGFMRINLACPNAVLVEALNRLNRFIESL